MIKRLNEYIIPGIFNQNLFDWTSINLEKTDFFEDLYTLLEKHKIKFQINSFNFNLGEEELIDLDIDIYGSFKNCSGTFHITWYYNDLKCLNLWFSGIKNNNGDDVFLEWENI